ncbi:MAG: tRNA 2-thiouridine(34) synthase MnmA [Bacteroidaceae bacterium]|nr:tRNA 2-thiouridine(34) synthase MnmA [Bacteroidaceae bacterium]
MDVALLASGGVDSAVATHLMVERGLRPTLYYIIIGAQEDSEFSCTMEEDLEMAGMLARQYGLRLETVDLHRDYWDRVVAYLVDRVKRGLTPNPDVMCNSLIKFGCFYDHVGRHMDLTVTGHYATTALSPEGHKLLLTAADPVKDQTDFLCQISREQLQGLEFPVGSMMKDEVRRIAELHSLAPAHRRDSQGICFLGKTDYNALLRRYLGEREGDIVEWETRTKLGRHPGYWFFTIGQRKGIGLSGGPWFVVRKDTRRNRIYISRNAEGLLCERMQLHDFHWLLPPLEVPAEGLKVSFKIRHSPEFEEGLLLPDTGGEGYELVPSSPMKGVAPGQFAVIYLPWADGRRLCIGSGEMGVARRPDHAG